MILYFLFALQMCMLPFSSSKDYLDWPRLHFSGYFFAHVSTVNNIRCNFLNEKFTATCLQVFPVLRENNGTSTYEDVPGTRSSWNPDGTGHFSFYDTTVTSFCESTKVGCSTTDPIVGLKVADVTNAVYVDTDTDFRVGVLYGLKISIDGILKADFEESEVQKESKSRGGAIHKSVLTKLIWKNNRYKNLFGEGELSISMTLDQFNMTSKRGRVTATIGSHRTWQDPLSMSAYRVLSPVANTWSGLAVAPFYYNETDKILSLDLSLSVNVNKDGNVNVRELGQLDLALISSEDCSSGNESGKCVAPGDVPIVKWLTKNGAVSKKIGHDNTWYNVYGGVLYFNLSNASSDMIQTNRLALVQQQSETTRSVMSEIPYAVRIGLLEKTNQKINHDDPVATEWKVFVSSYGKPLVGVPVSLGVIKNSKADLECGWKECKRELGTPIESLSIIPSDLDSATVDERLGRAVKTDKNGIATFTVRAVKDPGNPRGCGLDGQVYPLEIRLSYKNLVFVDGMVSMAVPPGSDYDYVIGVSTPAVMIYSDHEQKDDPTWEDVREIFQLYYNLSPVMWKNRIVDLDTYEGVKKSANAIKYAMESPVSDPRHMPITRDLSSSKLKVISTWFAKGMKRRPNEPSPLICSDLKVNETKNDLYILLQKAMMLELSTIPPYLTAWLSLKTEVGMNVEIAKIIHSVFVEEMFHLAFGANILNAIGGKVELTNYRNIPIFPTQLGFGAFFQINDKIMATLEPMSLDLVSSIFSGIEKPELNSQREVFQHIACILNLHITSNQQISIVTPQIIYRFIEDVSPSSRSSVDCNRQHGEDDQTFWNKVKHAAAKGLSKITKTQISSIGAFYGYTALKLSFVESCAQTNQSSNEELGHTLFTGKKGQLKFGEVFPVTSLQKAVEAVIAIVYEGEGGSECSPYVNNTGGANPDKELAHYYRFQEIVHGRKLVRIPPGDDVDLNSCLNLENDCQNEALKNPGVKYCYLGEKIPFNADGVWPMVSNPVDKEYIKDSNAEILNTQFNQLYTDTLKCLQTTFTGQPKMILNCISKMYDLAILGKRLASTPVEDGTYTGKHITPTWSLIRDEADTAGLPIVNSISKMYDLTMHHKNLATTPVQDGTYTGKHTTPTWSPFRDEAGKHTTPTLSPFRDEADTTAVSPGWPGDL